MKHFLMFIILSLALPYPTWAQGIDEGARDMDSLLSEKVRQRLEAETDIVPEHVDISAQGGMVQIEGALATLSEKRRVGKAARDVRGVRAVDFDVEILTRYVSDEELKRRLRRTMLESSIIDLRLPEISVKDGVVVLSGKMNSWRMRRMARRLAERVEGVKKVVNEVEVAQSPQKLSDEAFVKVIKRKIARDESISEPLVDVVVRQGVAHLSGYVATAEERRRVTQVTRECGVKGIEAKELEIQQDPSMLENWVRLTGRVSSRAVRRRLVRMVGKLSDARVLDGLEVVSEGSITDEDLKEAIEEAFAEDPYIDSPIRIRVEQGEVFLSGELHNSFEAERARNHAARLRGVEDIHDELAPRATYYFRRDEDLRDSLMAALVFSPFIDEESIEVTVDEGIVSLSGTVRSEAEEKRVIRKAFSEHAKDVRSELKIAKTSQ